MCHTPHVVLGLVEVQLGVTFGQPRSGRFGDRLVATLTPRGCKRTIPHDTAVQIGLRKTAEKPLVS